MLLWDYALAYTSAIAIAIAAIIKFYENWIEFINS